MSSFSGKNKKKTRIHTRSQRSKTKSTIEANFQTDESCNRLGSPGRVMTRLFENLGTKFVNFDRKPMQKSN